MVQIITGVKLGTKEFTSLVQLVKSKKILHEGGGNSREALQKESYQPASYLSNK